MNKTRKKPANYNDAAIKELMTRHGYTRNYILKAIRGERFGTGPVQVKEEYHQLDRAAKSAINRKASDL